MNCTLFLFPLQFDFIETQQASRLGGLLCLWQQRRYYGPVTKTQIPPLLASVKVVAFTARTCQ